MRNLIIIIVATTLAPAAAIAGGYTLPNENARSLGLAQSDPADQVGPDALFLNSSALAGMVGLAISGSIEYLDNRTTWSDPTLGDATLLSHANIPLQGAVSYGGVLDNGMGWGVAIGGTVPFGGSLYWPNGWPGQERVKSIDQEVFEFGGGAAFQPLPFLKLGASYLRYQSADHIHQEINYLDHFGDADLGLAAGANTFGVSAEIDVPTIPLRFAVNYKHSATISLDGHVHFSDVPLAFTPMIHDQGVTEQQVLPNVLDAAVAYEVVPHITLMFDYTFERWSQYRTDTFVGDDGFTVVVPRDYNNAHVFRIGGEWRNTSFLPELSLRLGGLRSLSDQPKETVSPTLTDGDSWAFSIGVGYDIWPSVRVDFGYEHAFFDTVTATGIEAFPGSYNTHVDLFSLGGSWRSDLGLSGRQ